MKYAELSGIKIALGNRERLLALSKSLVGKGGVIFTPNPYIMYLAKKSEAYEKTLSFASLNIPDGIGLVYLLRLMGYSTDAFPGVELAESLLPGNSFAVIGGKEGVAKRAAVRLVKEYRTGECKFCFSGYGIDENEIKAALKEHQPTLCLVCLGAPKQEFFIERIKAASPKTLFLALGGAVDVYAGDIRRAPKIFRRAHLEWLWRTVSAPIRISRLCSSAYYVLCEFFSVLNKKSTARDRKT